MLTQLDDDDQKFVVAYASYSNNKTKAKYDSYEGDLFYNCLSCFNISMLYLW